MEPVFVNFLLQWNYLYSMLNTSSTYPPILLYHSTYISLLVYTRQFCQSLYNLEHSLQTPMSHSVCMYMYLSVSLQEGAAHLPFPLSSSSISASGLDSPQRRPYQPDGVHQDHTHQGTRHGASGEVGVGQQVQRRLVHPGVVLVGGA